jgi:hypothetical protein
MRTKGAGCWICVGPQNFVEELYEQYLKSWEQWNLEEGHTALRGGLSPREKGEE